VACRHRNIGRGLASLISQAAISARVSEQRRDGMLAFRAAIISAVLPCSFSDVQNAAEFTSVRPL